MDFFIEHWRGRFSVAKAGWLGSLVAIVLVLPTNALELHSFFLTNNLQGFDDLIAHMQDGSIAALQMPSLFSQALDQVVEMAVLIWWSVGAWRSCNNPAHNRHGKDYFWFFKFIILLTAITEIYAFYDFIETATGLNG